MKKIITVLLLMSVQGSAICSIAAENFPFDLNRSINWTDYVPVWALDNMNREVDLSLMAYGPIREKVLRRLKTDHIAAPLLVLDEYSSVYWYIYVITREHIVRVKLTRFDDGGPDVVDVCKPQPLFLKKVEDFVEKSKSYKGWYNQKCISTEWALCFLSIPMKDGFRTIVWDSGLLYSPSSEYRVLMNFVEELQALFNKKDPVDIPLRL